MISKRAKKLITSFSLPITQLIWKNLACFGLQLFLKEVASAQLLLSTLVTKRSASCSLFNCFIAIPFKHSSCQMTGYKKVCEMRRESPGYGAVLTAEERDIRADSTISHLRSQRRCYKLWNRHSSMISRPPKLGRERSMMDATSRLLRISSAKLSSPLFLFFQVPQESLDPLAFFNIFIFGLWNPYLLLPTFQCPKQTLFSTFTLMTSISVSCSRCFESFKKV